MQEKESMMVVPCKLKILSLEITVWHHSAHGIFNLHRATILIICTIMNVPECTQHLTPPAVKINELQHDKTNKMTCVPSKNSDQPEHPPSLIRVFPVCMKKVRVLQLATHKVQSKDWSDWADVQADLSLRWVHRSFCWFCHAAAQIIKNCSLESGVTPAITRIFLQWQAHREH